MTNSPNIKTVISQEPYIILNNQGEILPSINLSRPNYKLGRDGQQVDLVVPQHWTVVSRVQACFRRQGDDYYIYDGDGTNPSSNKLFINNRVITPKEGYLLRNGDEINIGQDVKNSVKITYYHPNQPVKSPPLAFKSVSLSNRSVVLGRDNAATVVLDAPTISRQHAIIDIDNQNRYILYDKSTNGVFIDGEKVSGSAILTNGCTVRIGPYSFRLQGDDLVLLDTGDNIRLDAENIVRMVRDKKKQPLIILNHISLPIEPSQLVAIVGGSGAGKSTFLKTLLGIEPTTSGTVYLNGEELRQNFNIYRTQIGYVPQYDIVHRDLTVGEVLYYASKLRLPPDLNCQEVIEKTLQQVELLERRNTLVRDLSGGQLKRVSIAVELLANPKLFFLDEPTSGLDPGLDKKMMELLAKLAKEGRTILLVTHATNNINLCDRLVFLGQGGNLCYFGSPGEALNFFSLPQGDFADIYIHLETSEKVEQECQRFQQSDYYKNNIEARIGKVFQQNNSKPQQVQQSFWLQLQVLCQRYSQLIIRDQVSLILYLLTAPIGIFLMAMILRGKDPLFLADNAGTEDAIESATLALKTLFVFTCAELWVGFACSLQEIVKESPIYQRERLVNLGLLPYLFSKILVLAAVAFLQTIVITCVIFWGFTDPQPELMTWLIGCFITTFLTIFAAINLGLLISAGVSNITQANSALPLILIPQIIFAGVLFSLEGLWKYLSWLMISRWSIAAYGVLVEVETMIAEAKEQNSFNFPLPFEDANQVYQLSINNLLLNWGVLILHSLIYFLLTYWLQKRKDIL
jgi:ABC-type multidrug transport system ATPase subunit